MTNRNSPEGTRRVRVIFKDHIVEYPLPIAVIQSARLSGLPVRHPVDWTPTRARYSMVMVYWTSRYFVYVFLADD